MFPPQSNFPSKKTARISPKTKQFPIKQTARFSGNVPPQSNFSPKKTARLFPPNKAISNQTNRPLSKKLQRFPAPPVFARNTKLSILKFAPEFIVSGQHRNVVFKIQHQHHLHVTA
jgi:hypothetical protein